MSTVVLYCWCQSDSASVRLYCTFADKVLSMWKRKKSHIDYHSILHHFCSKSGKYTIISGAQILVCFSNFFHNILLLSVRHNITYNTFYTIPFGFSLFWHFRTIIFNFWNHFLGLRITEEGSLTEMRIWSLLLIKSDLKLCIHFSRSIFLYHNTYLKSHKFSCELYIHKHLITDLDLITEFDCLPNCKRFP